MACLLWLTDFQGFSMIDKLPDMPSGWEEEPVLPLQARITRGIYAPTSRASSAGGGTSIS